MPHRHHHEVVPSHEDEREHGDDDHHLPTTNIEAKTRRITENEDEDEAEDDDFNSNNDNTINSNKLVLWQGVALLTADCLGVGVLALPNDIRVLGYGLGLTFLILQFPINFYAGDLLSVMALQLETGVVVTPISRTTTTTDGVMADEYDLELHEEGRTSDDGGNDHDDDDDDEHDLGNPVDQPLEMEMISRKSALSPLSSSLDAAQRSPTMFHRHSKNSTPTSTKNNSAGSSSIHSYNEIPKVPSLLVQPTTTNKLVQNKTSSSDSFQDEPLSDHDEDEDEKGDRDGKQDDATIPSSLPTTITASAMTTPHSTYDLIGISKAIFKTTPRFTHMVILLYYLNLFLVLGDYILVMGRAVSALFLDQICLPTAGAIASVLMFAICQLRTMALLGKNVSLASLMAMVIVLIQCLFHHRAGTGTGTGAAGAGAGTTALDSDSNDSDIWAQFSALASIGFAVGSQKLFLNIRHELAAKQEASKVLAGSLTSYGVVYLVVILLAGSNPPSFLFDAIPEGRSRQAAGLLLWGHVAVSYAINSQALCSSMDRFWVASSSRAHSMEPRIRWFLLTFVVAVSSYLVSNAVPFFKDLVALIGALTSVPLTLTLPALLYRHFHRLRLCLPNIGQSAWWCRWARRRRRGNNSDDSSSSCGSYSLLLYSIAFLVVGLTGALSSIDEDWLSHGRPFSCR